MEAVLIFTIQVPPALFEHSSDEAPSSVFPLSSAAWWCWEMGSLSRSLLPRCRPVPAIHILKATGGSIGPLSSLRGVCVVGEEAPAWQCDPRHVQQSKKETEILYIPVESGTVVVGDSFVGVDSSVTVNKGVLTAVGRDQGGGFVDGRRRGSGSE